MPDSRHRHPHQEVETALRRLEANGWGIAEGPGGHSWGVATSPDGGSRLHIWASPASPTYHAAQLVRAALGVVPPEPSLVRHIAAGQLVSLARRQLGTPARILGSSPELPFPSFAVGSNELLGAAPTLLLGEPGSGKTTLLTAVTAKIQEAVLAGDAPYGAVLIPALQMQPSGSLTSTIRTWLSGYLDIDAEDAALASALRAGDLGVLLDGLDELPRAVRWNFSDILVTAISSRAVSRITASSRVVGSDPALAPVFRQVRVPPLTRDGAVAMLSAPAGSDLSPAIAERLYDLSAGNPLMLRMLSEAYRRRAHVPSTRSGLFRDAIEGLLVVLQDRVSDPGGATPSLDTLQRAYEELALSMLMEGRHEIPVDQAIRTLRKAGLQSSFVERLLDLDPQHGGLLRAGPAGTIGFIHLAMAEFLAASAVRDDSHRLRELAERPSTEVVVSTAISLSADPVEAVLQLADRPGLHSLRLSATAFSELPPGVAKRVRAALIQEIDALLGGQGGDSPPSEAKTAAAGDEPDLLTRWHALLAREAEGYERGVALELFMADFFGRFFEVVEHDYRTDIGQIDLLLSNTRTDPFWFSHFADMYVECKNTTRKTEQKEINDFAGKLAPGRTTLAFFVSQSGFTPPAWDRIRAAALDRAGTLIVPLTGAQIERTLVDGEEPEPFFKRLVRDTSHLRIF